MSSQGKQKGKEKRRSTQDDQEELSQSSSQRKRRGGNDEEVDDSQPGRSTQLSKAEYDAKVYEIVRYILFSDNGKSAVKRPDIVSKVLKEQSKLFPAVMVDVKKIFKKVFGFELVEVELGAAHTKSYLLINSLNQESEENYINWADQQPKMALLLVILSIIFMNGNVLPEELLWHCLKKMGMEPKKKHSVFGDVEKLINQEFVRQLYLERRKIAGREQKAHEYRWGVRANLEMTKRKVLEFVTQVYEFGTDIELWRSQYRQVLEEEAASTNNSS